MNDVVTRFAPSPTGYLHIGSIRTALINYIITQQAKLKFPKSKFILRIEDTDKNRSKKEFEKSIIDGLKWLGIRWDGDIVIQSNRIERHKEIANALLINNLAFKCICSSQELEIRRLINKKNRSNNKRLCLNCANNTEIQKSQKNHCVRIKIPINGNILINDRIQGKVKVENKELDDFILLRKDGSPTYMLSVVVDDHDIGVNTIIRGDDHLNNAFRQIHIYKHLKWDVPKYVHLPLIHGSDGSKLSKRHGAVDINELKKIGYLPQSIINNLILLGWSPKKESEIIEINEIINIFKIADCSKSSSIFDYKKLNYLNNNYLRKEKNYSYFEDFIQKNPVLNIYFSKDKNKIIKIFNAYNKNISYFNELIDIINIYFDDSFFTIKNDILDINFNFILKEFINFLQTIKKWEQKNLEININNFVQIKKIKFSLFGKPIRLVLTNKENGPPISEILNILGKENTFLRLNNYIKKI